MVTDAQTAPDAQAAAPVASRAREQLRAEYAMQAIKDVAHETYFKDRSYTGRAQNLPAMIQNLGLAGTIAFLLSKDDRDKALAKHLAQWLLSADADAGLPAQPTTDGAALESAISQTTWIIYRRATHEARLYAGWLKRQSKVQSNSGPQTTGTGNAAQQTEDDHA